MITSYTVSSLGEYYKVINDIAVNQGEVGLPLWFRGQQENGKGLLPSFFREMQQYKNARDTYTNFSLYEDYRYQNIQSKVYHVVDSRPESKIEWLEVYQHNLGRTRLLDWSESAKTSLLFALEALLDPKDNLELAAKRSRMSPVVWVLKPRELNYKVYQKCGMLRNKMFTQILGEFGNVSLFDIIKLKKLLKEEQVYFSTHLGTGSQAKSLNIDGIISLDVLDSYRRNRSGRMKEQVLRGEFNPFFYLLLRLYVDAIPVGADDSYDILPPVATLQPYHTERIRRQQGLFTMFPDYIFGPKAEQLKKQTFNIAEMQNQKDCQDCLSEIRIVAPGKIAKEMIAAGYRNTDVYPEVERFVENMEADKYHV